MLFSGYARNRGRFSPYRSFKDLMVAFEALDNLGESLSKGSLMKRFFYSLSLQTNKQKIKTTSSAFLPKIKSNEKRIQQYQYLFYAQKSK